MTVLVDSTPLISLSAIGRFNLLKELYNRLLIAPAVYHEVVAQGQGRPGAADVTNAAWIETHAIAPSASQIALPNLGKGEAETIILAGQLSADLVIIDEIAARRELANLSIRVIGSVGVLQQAKLRNLIPALKPELDALRRGGFHLSHRIYRAVLAAVGE